MVKIGIAGCGHGYMPEFKPCDIIIFTGDNEPAIDHYSWFQKQWNKDTFYPYLRSLPAKNVISISGNHSALQYEYEFMKSLCCDKVRYGMDEIIEVQGLKFWCSPWVTVYSGDRWFFGCKEQTLGNRFAEKAIDCFGIISHTPPQGIGDSTMDNDFIGSSALRNFAYKNRTRLICSSHCHEGRGDYRMGYTRVINASIKDENYSIQGGPVYIDIEPS